MAIEMIKSAFSRKLGRSVKFLVEISHPNLSKTYRIIDNTEAVTVDGDTFNPYPFKFLQNAQTETQGARLALSNVDRNLANELRNATDNENIICRIWVANVEKQGDTVNVERIDAGTFEVFSPVVTKEVTTFTLNLRVSLNYNLSTVRYNPNLFPNLYL